MRPVVDELSLETRASAYIVLRSREQATSGFGVRRGAQVQVADEGAEAGDRRELTGRAWNVDDEGSA
jgi:hypothetical protein